MSQPNAWGGKGKANGRGGYKGKNPGQNNNIANDTTDNDQAHRNKSVRFGPDGKPIQNGPSGNASDEMGDSSQESSAETTDGEDEDPNEDSSEFKMYQGPKRAATITEYTGERDFLKAQKARKDELEAGIRNGTIHDPNIPRNLEDAMQLEGRCEDMCSYNERISRAHTMEIDTHEIGKNNKFDKYTAVKKFRRPAAGEPEDLPSLVRTPQTLVRTTEYLVNMIDEKGLQTVHGFVQNRFRAIRKDFAVQHNHGNEAVFCYELIARFYFLCLHHMAPVNGYVAYNDQEQLEKTLISLYEFYNDRRKEGLPPCANEGEYRAYGLLLNLKQNQMDIKAFPEHVKNHSQVLQAQAVYNLVNGNTVSPAKNEAERPDVGLSWAQRFFTLVLSPQMSYMMTIACITNLQMVRLMALKSICRGYRVNSRYTRLELLAQMLGISNEEDVVVYLRHYQLDIKTYQKMDDATGQVTDEWRYVDVPRSGAAFLNNEDRMSSKPPARFAHLFEQKRGYNGDPDDPIPLSVIISSPEYYEIVAEQQFGINIDAPFQNPEYSQASNISFRSIAEPNSADPVQVAYLSNRQNTIAPHVQMIRNYLNQNDTTGRRNEAALSDDIISVSGSGGPRTFDQKYFLWKAAEEESDNNLWKPTSFAPHNASTPSWNTPEFRAKKDAEAKAAAPSAFFPPSAANKPAAPAFATFKKVENPTAQPAFAAPVSFANKPATFTAPAAFAPAAFTAPVKPAAFTAPASFSAPVKPTSFAVPAAQPKPINALSGVASTSTQPLALNGNAASYKPLGPAGGNFFAQTNGGNQTKPPSFASLAQQVSSQPSTTPSTTPSSSMLGRIEQTTGVAPSPGLFQPLSALSQATPATAPTPQATGIFAGGGQQAAPAPSLMFSQNLSPFPQITTNGHTTMTTASAPIDPMFGTFGPSTQPLPTTFVPNPNLFAPKPARSESASHNANGTGSMFNRINEPAQPAAPVSSFVPNTNLFAQPAANGQPTQAPSDFSIGGPTQLFVPNPGLFPQSNANGVKSATQTAQSHPTTSGFLPNPSLFPQNTTNQLKPAAHPLSNVFNAVDNGPANIPAQSTAPVGSFYGQNPIGHPQLSNGLATAMVSLNPPPAAAVKTEEPEEKPLYYAWLLEDSPYKIKPAESTPTLDKKPKKRSSPEPPAPEESLAKRPRLPLQPPQPEVQVDVIPKRAIFPSNMGAKVRAEGQLRRQNKDHLKKLPWMPIKFLPGTTIHEAQIVNKKVWAGAPLTDWLNNQAERAIIDNDLPRDTTYRLEVKNAAVEAETQPWLDAKLRLQDYNVDGPLRVSVNSTKRDMLEDVGVLIFSCAPASQYSSRARQMATDKAILRKHVELLEKASKFNINLLVLAYYSPGDGDKKTQVKAIEKALSLAKLSPRIVSKKVLLIDTLDDVESLPADFTRFSGKVKLSFTERVSPKRTFSDIEFSELGIQSSAQTSVMSADTMSRSEMGAMSPPSAKRLKSRPVKTGLYKPLQRPNHNYNFGLLPFDISEATEKAKRVLERREVKKQPSLSEMLSGQLNSLGKDLESLRNMMDEAE